MNASTPTIRPARFVAKALRRLYVPVAIALLWPALAHANTIENTASVSFVLAGTGAPVSLTSNTVYTEVLTLPAPGTIEFRRYDPGGPGGSSMPFDGGQCQLPGGAFSPLPDVTAPDGAPVDPVGSETGSADAFYVGEPIVVAVTDANRNADPATREYVEVQITTTTGDAETLRLLETAPDSGMFAGVIQSQPIPPAVTQYDCVLSLVDAAEITAVYTDADFPLDTRTVVAGVFAGLPPGQPILRLEQSVSRPLVEVGDFVQYTLVLRNTHVAPAFVARVNDVLPPGVRYREHSLRIGAPTVSGEVAAPPAGALADPQFGADGRSFTIPVGRMDPNASVTMTFVAEIGAGARGPELVNDAVAAAAGGIRSNDTQTVLRMQDALLTARMTVVGQVTVSSDCSATDAEGLAGVRVVMDDGSFAGTDAKGAYHFAGVRPGTHVVQVDVATLPPGVELAACQQNTRFAGRRFSQFVEGQGGSLLRADFRLLRGAPPSGEVGATVSVAPDAAGLRLTAEIDAGDVPIDKLRAMLMLPDGARYVPGSAQLEGKAIADPELNDTVAVFDLGDQGARWRKRLSMLFEPGACTAKESAVRAVALFEAGGKTAKTSPAELAWTCGAPPGQASSPRSFVGVTAAAGQPAASPFHEESKARAAIVDDVEADGGGDIDWFAGQKPGRDWLFPAEGRSPRSSTTRVVLKYQAGDRPALRINGEPVSPLKFDGTVAGAGGISIGTWRGIPLREGDNLLQAEILDGAGNVVAKLERTVFYSNSAARAELVAEQSILVADGIHKPVIAVRMLDRHGNPVRKGVSGEFTLSPPYMPATSVQAMQERQLAGSDGAMPTWTVEGDEGIAYIELAPTGTAGSFKLAFQFGSDRARSARQEIEGWLKSAPRDWIVVGFAKGSVGYDTLEDNMEPLADGEEGSGMRTDGQVSLYAKGRVLGSWMLTLAYDSGKPTDRAHRANLLSTIDPQQYYTLYGDGSHQGYDASSIEKVYLKLERDQFYALFGDFQTGLDHGELSRYQRTLNGAKVEYHGPMFEFNGFAAKTSQSFARDELPGDGTSGLYRMTHRGVLINSERVRIETRDRYHSEQILKTQQLSRHIDYDIDYDNGTLFFREPIAGRDFDFNPVFIVVEYETRGTAEEFVAAGGRAGVRMMGGRLQAGVTHVRDEDMDGSSRLTAVDAKFKLGPNDEIRAEAATSDSRGDDSEVSGNAWLFEYQHQGERANLLAYVRRQGLGFGLGQQNRTETGMAKAGVQARWRVSDHFSLQGEAYRLENLASGAVRDAVRAEGVYTGDDWNASAGLQLARDEGADGRVAESRQVTVGAAKYLMDHRLELNAKAEVSLGGSNDSVDFPTRLQIGAAYAINKAFRLLAAHEITDGEDRDTATTRIGFEASPWKNARLSSTLNQSRISEYGPRTFALFGLNQRFLVGERWGFDVSLDSSHAFNETGRAPLVVDPAQPIAAGGIRDGGALTSDYTALSGGATYRTELWSWNARAEGRQGDTERYGFSSAFLRQARDGVALSASLQAFSQRSADGSTGLLANAQLSWAYRPFGSRWSMLDKLEFRLDELTRGNGQAIFGQNTLAATGDARSRRLVNNFVLNYASESWAEEDTRGVLSFDQGSQLSVYYGSKYVLDTFGSDDYAGYSDILGAEWRIDLGPKLDLGIRASVLHSWSQDSYAWAFGPSLGFTPFTNAWVSLGYNIKGFNDRDFQDAHHTAEGFYLVFRMKFDQDTLGLGGRAAAP